MWYEMNCCKQIVRFLLRMPSCYPNSLHITCKIIIKASNPNAVDMIKLPIITIHSCLHFTEKTLCYKDVA